MIDIEKEEKAYRAYLILRNFQPSTVKMYTRTLEFFLNFCNERFGGQALSQEQVQQYLLMRIEKEKAWATINIDYSALRKYYKGSDNILGILKNYPDQKKKRDCQPSHRRKKLDA